MKCPNDETVLVMSDRQGIEIDYCPQCRGVWLDRGELDKIIEKSAATTAPPASNQPQREERSYSDDRNREPTYNDRPSSDRDYDRRDSDKYYRKHKKESFLGDLFDF